MMVGLRRIGEKMGKYNENGSELEMLLKKKTLSKKKKKFKFKIIKFFYIKHFLVTPGLPNMNH